MADTLKRVAGPVSLTDTAATVYTVPALTVTTITAIHVANETDAAATFTISVGSDATGKRFFYNVRVLAGNALDWAGTLVLTAAEVVQAYSDTDGSLTLTMSGVESD